MSQLLTLPRALHEESDDNACEDGTARHLMHGCVCCGRAVEDLQLRVGVVPPNLPPAGLGCGRVHEVDPATSTESEVLTRERIPTRRIGAVERDIYVPLVSGSSPPRNYCGSCHQLSISIPGRRPALMSARICLLAAPKSLNSSGGAGAAALPGTVRGVPVPLDWTADPKVWSLSSKYATRAASPSCSS